MMCSLSIKLISACARLEAWLVEGVSQGGGGGGGGVGELARCGRPGPLPLGVLDESLWRRRV